LQEPTNKSQSTNIETETLEDIKLIVSSENKIPFKFEWGEGVKMLNLMEAL